MIVVDVVFAVTAALLLLSLREAAIFGLFAFQRLNPDRFQASIEKAGHWRTKGTWNRKKVDWVGNGQERLNVFQAFEVFTCCGVSG